MNNTFICVMDVIFAAYNNATLVPNTLSTKSLNQQNSQHFQPLLFSKTSVFFIKGNQTTKK